MYTLKTWLKSTPLGTLHRTIHRELLRRTRIRDFWRPVAADAPRMKLYGQLIAPGDLVFDVGANMGNRTKAFLLLNARVLAVEPQAGCAELLDSVLAGNPRFRLIRKAVGRKPGRAQMLICDDHTLSTLSMDWLAKTRDSRRFQHQQWQQRQDVEVTTLDELIDQFGTPAFTKIDVEGSELEVLNGLSYPLRCLSIEFIPECMEKAYQCIDRLCELAEYECQISIGESMRFYLPHWSPPAETKSALGRLHASVFGDIYFRLKPVVQSSAVDVSCAKPTT